MRKRFLGLLCGVAVLLAAVLAAGTTRAAERLRGTVVRSADGTVELDIGSIHGVVEGSRFSVFSMGKIIRIPLTGTVAYKEGEAVGVIRVVDAGGASSRCETVAVVPGRTITTGQDAVYLSGPVATSTRPAPPPEQPPPPPPPPEPTGPTELTRTTGTLDAEGTLKAPTVGDGGSLAMPTGVALSADPARPAPGGAVRLTVQGLDRAPAGYRIRWTCPKGNFSAEETASPSVTWTAPRSTGKHIIGAKVVFADGKTIEGRGVIVVMGTSEVPEALAFERVMGHLAYEGKQPLRILDVAFDEDGAAYILDSRLRCVLRLGRGSKVTAAASQKTCADAGLRDPRALAVRGGKIYILDGIKPHVKVFEQDKLAMSMECPKKMGNPVDLAVDGRGFAYVADRTLRCFHVFNNEGKYLHPRGARGRKQLGHFELPVAIATAPGGNILVLDRIRKDIQVFGPTWSVLSKIDVRVRRGGQLMDLDVAPDGKSVYVLEGPRGLVARYGVDGEVISYPEKDKAKFPALPPKVSKMAVDGLGRVYVLAATRLGV